MRDDAPPGVNNIGDASIADLGLLHNFLKYAEIKFDDAHASVSPRTGQRRRMCAPPSNDQACGTRSLALLSRGLWAAFRSTKAAVKLHTLLDLRGSIPTFIHISDGKMHDVNVLDLLLIEAGAFYIMDRGYLDFERLYAHDQAGGFFITRAKRNLDARRVYSAPVDRDTRLICDQTIALNGFYAAKHYPVYLRRIRYRDPEMTNQFAWPALTICALYRCRWQVELFFSSESSSTCASNASTALPRTLCGRKSGSPSTSTCWWRSSRRNFV